MLVVPTFRKYCRSFSCIRNKLVNINSSKSGYRLILYRLKNWKKVLYKKYYLTFTLFQQEDVTILQKKVKLASFDWVIPNFKEEVRKPNSQILASPEFQLSYWKLQLFLHHEKEFRRMHVKAEAGPGPLLAEAR